VGREQRDRFGHSSLHSGDLPWRMLFRQQLPRGKSGVYGLRGKRRRVRGGLRRRIRMFGRRVLMRTGSQDDGLQRKELRICRRRLRWLLQLRGLQRGLDLRKV